MVTKVADEIKFLDRLLWIIAFALIVAGVSGNYYFSDQSLLLRIVGILICAGIVLGVAYKTAFGQRIWTQWLEAVQEVRKMVWPTRQETLQTTLAVLAMVSVMGLLLWTADFVLLRVVKWLTGHWGV
jgi:preprotein translocase subunit SecE